MHLCKEKSLSRDHTAGYLREDCPSRHGDHLSPSNLQESVITVAVNKTKGHILLCMLFLFAFLRNLMTVGFVESLTNMNQRQNKSAMTLIWQKPTFNQQSMTTTFQFNLHQEWSTPLKST